MLKKYKKDIILITCIVVIAVIFFLVINFTKQNGKYVVVIYNQTEVARYNLDDDIEITLSYIEGSYNMLVIKDGYAFIKEASCPDKLCTKYGKISKTGESITCLPNKLVVKIIGEDNEVDVNT